MRSTHSILESWNWVVKNATAYSKALTLTGRASWNTASLVGSSVILARYAANLSRTLLPLVVRCRR